MAPADQGTGDSEDNPWTELTYGLFPEDDIATSADPYLIQSEISLLDYDGNFSFDILNNTLIMQAPVGMDGTPQASSNNINNVVANANDSRGHTYANTPRGGVAMEQIQTILPPFQVADGNIEPQHLLGNPILAEKGQDEPEYVTDTKTPHVSKRARKNPSPSSEEWQKWKPEIHSLYMVDNYTLEVTRAKMATKGFYAESVTVLSLHPESIMLTLHKCKERGCTKRGSKTGAGERMNMIMTVETPEGNFPL
jgi:hypothetical protein